MNLEECRLMLDEVDGKLVELFCRRMKIVSDVADYKKANDIMVQDRGREEKVLLKVAALTREYPEEVKELYEEIFKISRDYQEKKNGKKL